MSHFSVLLTIDSHETPPSGDPGSIIVIVVAINVEPAPVPTVAKRPNGVGTIHGNPAGDVPGGRTAALSSFHGCRDLKT